MILRLNAKIIKNIQKFLKKASKKKKKTNWFLIIGIVLIIGFLIYMFVFNKPQVQPNPITQNPSTPGFGENPQMQMNPESKVQSPNIEGTEQKYDSSGENYNS